MSRASHELVEAAKITAGTQSTRLLGCERDGVLPVRRFIRCERRDDAWLHHSLKESGAVGAPGVGHRTSCTLEEGLCIVRQVDSHGRPRMGGKTSSSGKSAGSRRTSANSASSCSCAWACCVGVAWSVPLLQSQLVSLTWECTALAHNVRGVG